jgi:hypothetical protein
MNNPRLRPWAALALSFSLCGGLVCFPHSSMAVPTTQGAKKSGTPLDDVLRKLNLSADQKTAAGDILDNANSLIKALNANTTLTVAEKKAAHKAICDDTYTAIGAILTPEQKTIFDAWVAAQPTGKPPKEEKPKGEKPEKPKGEKPKEEKPKGGSGGDCKDKPKGPTGDKTTPTTPTSGGDSGNSA